MKKLKLVFSFLSILIVVTTACQDGSNQEQEKSEALKVKVNWSDTTQMSKVIDRFYKDSVYGRNEIALTVEDPFYQSELYVQLHKIYRSEFKPVSGEIGYMPVLMVGGRDSAVVDFKMKWIAEDTSGRFVVDDYYLQSYKREPRYRWTKDGEYWKRENVEKFKKAI